MKKILIYTFVFLCFIGITITSNTQNVGINAAGISPDNSAMLDISSSDEGILMPRMDSTSGNNIVSPAKGLRVFDSTYNSFYYYNGTNWTAIGFGSAWGTEKLEFSSYMDSPNGNGWNVNRVKFDHLLFKEACKKGAIGVTGSRVQHTNLNSDQVWNVEWMDSSGKNKAKGRFLLNACGRKNKFHKIMDDEQVIYDNLVSVALFLKGYKINPEAAFIESVELGWWYFAPLPSGNSIVMLMTDLDIVTSLKLTVFENWHAEHYNKIVFFDD